MALSKNLLKIIERKNARIDIIPNNLFSAVESAQPTIYDNLILLINQLQFDGNDALIVNSNNLQLINTITDQLRPVVNQSGYLQAVTEFIGQFESQAILNDNYFSTLIDNYNRPDVLNALLDQRKRSALNSMLGASLDKEFFDPITSFLNESVSTGSSRQDLLKGLRLIVEGDKKTGRNGKLLFNIKQIARDAFSTTDRAFTNVVADDLGLEFGFYSGGLLTDSRLFCVNRNGKYFHNQELKDWGNGLKIDSGNAKGKKKAGNPWQGKIDTTDGTTIFTNLGGYNCLHSYMPVSLKVVPITDIQRNVENGNFTPTEFEKRELGI